jgi:hypothetical protein
MAWIKKIWSILENFLAPILAYIKGRIDQKNHEELKNTKKELEEVIRTNERQLKIVAKYNRYRDDIKRMREHEANTKN